MKILILVIGIIIAVLMFLFTFRSINKKFKDKEKEKPVIYLSKTGSIIFYSLIFALFIFFGLMYIMWKMQ